VPKPVAIRSNLTTAIDKTARELAADFGLTNFRSPQVGQAAMPPPSAPSAKRNTFEPQKGWRIDLPDEALSGAGHAVCAPANVTAKIKVDPNAGALPPSSFGPADLRSPDALRQNTRIEGSHRGRIER
jgi:hypothetical protein